jgi:uncharacterized protein GlcG (DUF336 family)
MKRFVTVIEAVVAIAIAAILVGGLSAGPASAADINLNDAVAVANAAFARATAIGVPMDIAIVDRTGRLKAFARMDGAWIGSIDIAQAKAFTATAFCNDNASPVCVNTQQLKPLVQPGADLFGLISTNRKDGIVAFDGGVTLCTSGAPIGAIGVSGGTIAQDHDVARTAAVNTGHLCAGQ